MSRAKSVIRTLTLQFAAFAGHTVRVSNVLPGLAGAAMVSWGAAMIYTPAGLITGGLLLLGIGFETNQHRAATAPPPVVAPYQES